MNHDDRVREFMRSYIDRHRNHPKQREVLEAVRGKTQLIKEAWQRVRNEAEFTQKPEEFEESFNIHNDTATKATAELANWARIQEQEFYEDAKRYMIENSCTWEEAKAEVLKMRLSTW